MCLLLFRIYAEVACGNKQQYAICSGNVLSSSSTTSLDLSSTKVSLCDLCYYRLIVVNGLKHRINKLQNATIDFANYTYVAKTSLGILEIVTEMLLLE